MDVEGSLPSSQEPANGQYVDVLCVPEPSLLGRYTLSIEDKELPSWGMIAARSVCEVNWVKNRLLGSASKCR